MNKPLISIIVLTYNDYENTKKFLKSVKKSSFNLNKVEIILYDNGSTKSIKNSEVDVYIKNKKNIGSLAYTESLKIAKGKYVFFCDSDLILEKNCIKELFDFAKKTKQPNSPVFFNYDKKPLFNTIEYSKQLFYFNGNYNKDLSKTKPYSVLYGGILFIEKELIKEIGGLYDYFAYAEDLYLGIRLRLTGNKLYWNPKAKVYMNKSNNTARKIFNSEKNTLITFFRVMEIKNIIKYFPLVYGIRFLAIIKDLFSLKFNFALYRFFAVICSLFDLRDRTIQKKRIIKDNKVFYDSNTINWFKRTVI